VSFLQNSASKTTVSPCGRVRTNQVSRESKSCHVFNPNFASFGGRDSQHRRPSTVWRKAMALKVLIPGASHSCSQSFSVGVRWEEIAPKLFGMRRHDSTQRSASHEELFSIQHTCNTHRTADVRTGFLNPRWFCQAQMKTHKRNDTPTGQTERRAGGGTAASIKISDSLLDSRALRTSAVDHALRTFPVDHSITYRQKDSEQTGTERRRD